MHESAYISGKCFFDLYTTETSKILEIGSQNVNGSLRDHSKSKDYTGVDFVKGKGVDVILEDPYKYPFESNTFDVIVTSSCFEHSEMFWLSFIECLRVLKPTGVLYYNVPALFAYHRYPVDCWRFMPDSAKALETWGNYNNIPTKVIESFIIQPKIIDHYDCCSIYIKDKANIELYKNRVSANLNLTLLNIYSGDWSNLKNFNKMSIK